MMRAMRHRRDDRRRELGESLAYASYMAATFVLAAACCAVAIYADPRGIRFSGWSWLMQLVYIGIVTIGACAIGSAGLWLTLRGAKQMRFRLRHYGGAGAIFAIATAAFVFTPSLPDVGFFVGGSTLAIASIVLGVLLRLWPAGTRVLFRGGAIMVLPLLWLAKMQLKTLRSHARPNVCPRCGYDLRQSPLRCPECGTIIIRRLRKLSAVQQGL